MIGKTNSNVRAERVEVIKNYGYQIETEYETDADGNRTQILNISGYSYGEDEDITIQLPSEFANLISIFNFKLNDNEYLFSGSISGVNIGVWKYTINTNTWEQLYNKSQGWKYFQLLSNGDCLISSDNVSDSLLLYEKESNTIVEISSISNLQYFQPLLNGNCLISSSSSYKLGVFLYNITNKTVTQLYDKYFAWKHFHSLSNGDYLISNTNNTAAGILLYSIIDNTIVQIYDVGYNYQYSKLLPNGDCFLSSSINNYSGILLYSSETKLITKIYETGSSWKHFQLLSNGDYLIASEASSSTGVLLYSTADKTVVQLYDTGYKWSIFQLLSNGDCLINSNYSGVKGILLYNSSDKTITQAYTTGYNINFQLLPNGNCLMFGASQTGIFLYQISTRTFITVDRTTQWNNCKLLSNGNCLIIGQNGVGLYKITDNSFKKLFSVGSWNIFELIQGDDYYIKTTVISQYTQCTLKYTNENETAIMYLYTIGA